MSTPREFPKVSLWVLNALDRDLPGWQEWVPKEKYSELNEESLIQLIRDVKREETYRLIAERRSGFFQEAYEGSEKSFFQLQQEFSDFSYEQVRKWMEMEGKLTFIIFGFRARSESLDFNEMGKDVDLVGSSIEKQVDEGVNSFNSYIDSNLQSFLGRTVEGEPLNAGDELKGLMRNSVSKFKEENKKLGEKQKEFINNCLKKTIQNKVEKIRSGELSKDAWNRSDLFTDEEVRELQSSQNRVILDAVRERKQSNINSMNEVAKKFLGVSGKEEIIKKIDELPEEVISPEIKKIVEEAFDRGGVFPNERNSKFNRSKRSASVWSGVASLMLDYTASKLDKLAKMSDQELKSGRFYKRCKFYKGKWWFWLISPIVGAVCEIHVGVVDMGIARKIYSDLSKVLSYTSFIISVFSADNLRERISELMKFGMSKICDAAPSLTKNKIVNENATLCSATLTFINVLDVYWKASGNFLAQALSVFVGVDTTLEVINTFSNQ